MNVSLSILDRPVSLIAALLWCSISSVAVAQIKLAPVQGTQIQLKQTQPNQGPPADGASAGHPPNSKIDRPCVLLKNDNVLFGEAQQLGEFIIIRTGPEDELKLPRTQVACWAKSLTDLYRYRLDHRPSADLASLLIDAKWCLQYELYDLAAQELQAAKQLAPMHSEVRLLEGRLQRRTRPTDSNPTPRGTVAAASFSDPSPATDNGGANRIDPEMLKAFAGHVQPVLLNKCGRCHKQESDREWRLTLPTTGSRATAQLTRENLNMALRFLDPGNPEQSPLLIKGTSPHGDSSAPLTPRNAGAITSLRRWVHLASRAMEQPKFGKAVVPAPTDRAGPPDPIASLAQVAYTSDSTPDVPSVMGHPNQRRSRSNPAEIPTKSDTPDPTGFHEGAASKPDEPQRLPTVADPFDPSLFNRRFHRGSE